MHFNGKQIFVATGQKLARLPFNTNLGILRGKKISSHLPGSAFMLLQIGKDRVWPVANLVHQDYPLKEKVLNA